MASQAIKFHVHQYSSIYLNRHGNGTSVNPNPVDSSQGRILRSRYLRIITQKTVCKSLTTYETHGDECLQEQL
jgi:hypothetical protein